MKELLERIKFSFQLWKGEREKRKEGFPKEWFDDNPIDEDYIPLEEYKDER